MRYQILANKKKKKKTKWGYVLLKILQILLHYSILCPYKLCKGYVFIHVKRVWVRGFGSKNLVQQTYVTQLFHNLVCQIVSGGGKNNGFMWMWQASNHGLSNKIVLKKSYDNFSSPKIIRFWFCPYKREVPNPLYTN